MIFASGIEEEGTVCRKQLNVILRLQVGIRGLSPVTGAISASVQQEQSRKALRALSLIACPQLQLIRCGWACAAEKAIGRAHAALQGGQTDRIGRGQQVVALPHRLHEVIETDMAGDQHRRCRGT